MFVSLAALVAGGLLASAPTPVRVSTFLAVILGSVYVRRFGRRGHGLGVFGFMTFFLTPFLGTAAGPCPPLFAVTPAAFAIAALVRVAVLPTPGPATRTRALRAWDRLLAATVRQTATVSRTPRPRATPNPP
ncbi:hypothetical protein ACIRL2_18995 [Embleya sp. NPDC127516]|uniref:hypothetical protein n=1 Tax=Embleya sp. NPDC127516 TaxID=3363990 RepID=UPI0038080F9B